MGKKMGVGLWWMMLLLLLLAVVVGGETLQEQCSDKLQSVMQCLSFADGKSQSPTKECCGSVSEIRGTNPACLCFFIEQIHNGSNAQLKQLGIQESRLLQLPSACNLANASVSNCPRLLNLPPNSPDAAFFSSNLTSTPSPSSSSPGTASPVQPSSGGFLHQAPQFAASVIGAVAVYSVVVLAGQLLNF